MAKVTVEQVHGPATREVLKGLRDANTRAFGKFDHKPLTVTLRERGKIVGGLVGETYLGWMFVKWFWIADKHRGKGHGLKILRTAEDEARGRGVTNAYIDTFSFQAPGFYRKAGYREFGRLDGFPPGHYRVWVTKAL
jgi:GNAT superfamily N-acetyltransferase